MAGNDTRRFCVDRPREGTELPGQERRGNGFDVMGGAAARQEKDLTGTE